MFNLEKLKKNSYTFNADIERYKLNKNNNKKTYWIIKSKVNSSLKNQF